MSTLLETIGADAMQKLVDEFGGQMIYVPTKVPNPDRDDDIRATFSESLKTGSTCMNAYNLCASQSGLSLRRVQEIVSR